MGISLRNTLQKGAPEAALPTLFGPPEDSYDEANILPFIESEFPTADNPFWSGVGSLFAAGKLDRYHFTFSESHILRTLPVATVQSA